MCDSNMHGDRIKTHEVISVLLFTPAQAYKQLQIQIPIAANNSCNTTTDRSLYTVNQPYGFTLVKNSKH
jgi:hypothetical protein